MIILNRTYHTKQWMNIIQPIAPYLVLVLQSQFGYIALSICVSHYKLENKSFKNFIRFISTSDSNTLKQLYEIETKVTQELLSLNITKSDLINNNQITKPKFNFLFVKILSLLTTFGFFMVLFFMLFYNIPDASKDALLIMLGALCGGWTSMLSYYFGSSSGQDNIIQNDKRNDLDNSG